MDARPAGDDTDRVAPEIRNLDTALDAVGDLEPTEFSGSAGSANVMALSSIRSRLEALEARGLAAWDANRVWAEDRAKTGAAWISYRCRISMPEARARVRFARRLKKMPLVEAALLDGSITTTHAKRLGHAARRSSTAFARDEEMLIGHARELRFADFERAVTYWEQLVDDKDTEKDAKRLVDERELFMSQTLGGSWAINGTADPIRGTIIHNVLSSIERSLFEAEWADAKARLGEAVTIHDLARTPCQRRLDALVLMAMRAATAPKDGTPPRPLFTVLVDYPATMGRICQLADGLPVTPGQLAPYLSDADLERIVFSGRSRVLDVGPRSRLFRGATRRAVEVRDLFCQGFACDVPADRCDVDHIVRYEDGGPTVQENGRLLCPSHHPGRRNPERWWGPDPPEGIDSG